MLLIIIREITDWWGGRYYSQTTSYSTRFTISKVIYIICENYKFYLQETIVPYRFDNVISRIKSQYDEVERALIEEFCNAQRKNDLKRMKQIANLLSQFRSYSQCVDAYIEQSQAVKYCNPVFCSCYILVFLGLSVK